MTDLNKSGVSRRTLAKGAAWTAPAIAVAAAAPLVAASPLITFTFQSAWKVPGSSCKPYRKGYILYYNVCNVHSSRTVSVDLPRTITASLGGQAKTFDVYPTSVPNLKPGECRTVAINLFGEPNSSDSSISGSFPYSYQTPGGARQTDTAVFSAGATPPLPSCPDKAATDEQPAAEARAAAEETTAAEVTTTTTTKTVKATASAKPTESASVKASAKPSATASSKPTASATAKESKAPKASATPSTSATTEG